MAFIPVAKHRLDENLPKTQKFAPVETSDRYSI